MKFVVILFSVFVLVTVNLFSQETGSFNKTINFNNEDRTVSYYVPSDYDAENSYRLMVCLHGMGDNSTNFRNALISSLRWNTFMENMIFACPDGGSDNSRDFYDPNGDEFIIYDVIDSVKSMYNIDTTQMYIEGFSLGGRSALKFALDNPGMFKGVLLNTPAMQGTEDSKNNPNWSLMFDYANAKENRIAISHGETDVLYLFPIATMYDSLVYNNGTAFIQTIEGMGHNVASQTYMQECMNFLENPTENEYDVELFDIKSKYNVCSENETIDLGVRNVGSNTISKVSLKYYINEEELNVDFDLSLEPYEYTKVSIPIISLNEGKNTIRVVVFRVNEDMTDADETNNEEDVEMWFYPNGKALPEFIDFESEEDLDIRDWKVNIGSAAIPWVPDNVAKTGEGSLFTFNTIFLFYNEGSREEIQTPILDLSSIDNPGLRFDMAYSYHLFTPPYFTDTTAFADTLEILISSDCGETFEVLYKKGGDDLLTAETPIINPLSIDACFFIPSQDEWRTEEIDLSNYQDMNNVMLKLSYISALGGSINIDNIAITDISLSVAENKNNLKLYPNPTSDFIIIDSDRIIESIVINDLLGNNVLEMDNPGDKIDVSHLQPGIYFVRVGGEFSKFVKM